MTQYMKFANGEIADIEFIKNPIDVDWRVEYKRNALENTSHNAAVLCMVYTKYVLLLRKICYMMQALKKVMLFSWTLMVSLNVELSYQLIGVSLWERR